MLSETKMHKSFWPEAVRWSFYLLNRCPNVSFKDLTPEEAWSNVKPTVKHLRVFGCVAYMHIPNLLERNWMTKVLSVCFLCK